MRIISPSTVVNFNVCFIYISPLSFFVLQKIVNLREKTAINMAVTSLFKWKIESNHRGFLIIETMLFVYGEQLNLMLLNL